MHIEIHCIGDSNRSKAMFAPCICFITSERMRLSQVVCSHFIMHRQESEVKSRRKIRETTGVPVSLQISLSELSHIKYTHTQCTHTKSLCVDIVNVCTVSLRTWLKILEYLGGKQDPSAPTCVRLYLYMSSVMHVEKHRRYIPIITMVLTSISCKTSVYHISCNQKNTAYFNVIPHIAT